MKLGTLLSSLVLTVIVTAIATPASAIDRRPIGRWDITVDDNKVRTPSWIEIREVDNKLVARFCSEVRGVYDVGEVKVNGQQVTFKSIDQKDYPNRWYTYTGNINDDSMFGNRDNGIGPKQIWFAKRFVPKINVAGQWHCTDPKDSDSTIAILTLSHDNSTINGTFQQTDIDRQLQIVGAQLDGNVLIFELGEVLTIEGDTGPIDMFDTVTSIRAKVKGDVLEGTTQDSAGNVSPLIAYRQREWDKPIQLFNGKDLKNWKPFRDPGGRPRENKWSIVDGIMTCAGRSQNIMSMQKFMDFKIHVEFRVPEKGNSGVYLRGRYEIQVADSFGKPVKSNGCGGMYSRITPLVNASKPAGEWQTFDATLVGQYITLKHNGVLIVDNQELEGITGGAIDSQEGKPGPIYLQGDHKKIEYRKIIVYPAPPAPSSTGCASRPAG